jgi:hypothetical protein
MIRGTTAQFKFNLPYPLKDITSAEVNFWQKADGVVDGKTILVTRNLMCSGSGDPLKREVYVLLTQEETLRFSEKKHGYVQFRGVAADGSVFASKQEDFIVYPFCKDDPIGGVTPPADEDDNGWIIINSGVVGNTGR